MQADSRTNTAWPIAQLNRPASELASSSTAAAVAPGSIRVRRFGICSCRFYMLTARDASIASNREPAGVADTRVGTPAVGDDMGPWFVVIGDEGVQGRRGPVRQDCHPAPPVSARGCRISTAMPTSTFLPLARPPASPGSSPPM